MTHRNHQEEPMRNKQRGDAEVGAAIFMILVVVIGWLIFAPWSCHSRWGGSNMDVSWGPIQGCKVKLPDGRWLPEDRVREVELPRKQP